MNAGTTEIVSKMFTLSHKITYYKSKFYDKNFKVNALSEKEISGKQFMILMLIGFAQINTITEIAAVLNQTTGSVSTVMGKMVKNGIIAKSYPEGRMDKRRVYYNVTEYGQRICHKFINHLMVEIKAFLHSMDPERIQNFEMGYDCIAKILHKTEHSNVFDLICDFSVDSLSPEDATCLDIVKQMSSLVVWVARYYLKEMKIISNSCQSSCLTPGRMRILAFVCGGHYESIAQVASFIDASESAVSNNMSKLVDEGYIRRVYPKEDEDGRKVYFHPTKKGVEAYEEARKALIELLESYYNTFPADVMESYKKGVDYLLMAFE